MTNEEVSIVIIYLNAFSSHPVGQLAASLPSKTLPVARAKRGSKHRSERQNRPAASHANTTTDPTDGDTSNTPHAEIQRRTTVEEVPDEGDNISATNVPSIKAKYVCNHFFSSS